MSKNTNLALVIPPAEVNVEIARLQERLGRMKANYGAQRQAELAAMRIEEFPEQTANTRMAQTLAGHERRWHQYWRRFQDLIFTERRHR